MSSETLLATGYAGQSLPFISHFFSGSDGKEISLREFVPRYIPENYRNELPKKFRVLSKTGKGEIKFGSDDWPKDYVPSTFWKFTFEGDFKLNIGERYMDDGRFSNWAEIRFMYPSGMATSMIILGATGSGKSQASVLPYSFQILAWNANVDSERESVERLRAYADRMVQSGGDTGDFENPFKNLAEEALDTIQADGRGYAFEKCAMFLVEPKGEMYADIQEQLAEVGRSQDFVSLGSDLEKVGQWQSARQNLRKTALELYQEYDFKTAWNVLEESLVQHLKGFWRSEIIRRFTSGDFQSFGPGKWEFSGTSKFFILSDFEHDAPCPEVKFGSNGYTSLGGLLSGLENETRVATQQVFPASGFGIVEGRTENLFLGLCFDKEGVLNTLSSGGIPVGDQALVKPFKAALKELLALVNAAVGDLSTSEGELAQSDGLLGGLRPDGVSMGMFPSLRPIGLLAGAPPPSNADPNSKPDLLTLIKKDISGNPPIEPDETRIRKMIRFLAPPVRRPGEKYSEWVFRKKAFEVYSKHRNKGFYEQYRRVLKSLQNIGAKSERLKKAYREFHTAFDGDSRVPVAELVGDMDMEMAKGAMGLSAWQNVLRRLGLSPIAEMATGEYEHDIRVGLLPVDSGWNLGCWKVLLGLMRGVAEGLIEEFARKVTYRSEGHETNEMVTKLRLDTTKAFKSIDGYVEACHRYFAVMVPATMGNAVWQVDDVGSMIHEVEGGIEKLGRENPRDAADLKTGLAHFRAQGHIGYRLAQRVNGVGVKCLVRSFGDASYNPIYNEDAPAQAVANEFTAAATVGENSSEHFWQDAYTSLMAGFVQVCMAADGWVTITDVLQCFMESSFYERKLMVAEQRLNEIKRLAGRYSDGSLAPSDGSEQAWGESGLAVCMVAEREWALASMREICGMNLAPGSWLGKAMDSGGGLVLEGRLTPVRHVLRVDHFEALGFDENGGWTVACREFGRDPLVGEGFRSAQEMVNFLRAGKFHLPSAGEPVTEMLAYQVLDEERAGLSKVGKEGVNRIRLNEMLCRGIEAAVVDGWAIQHGPGSKGKGKLWFNASVAMTPPPIQAEDVQKLETAVQQFKSFIAQTLQGEVLGDPKTKANILVSFQVKVDQLKSDAAMYSFAPGSKWDITFPTFPEMRTQGKVIVSRITDRVYLGIDQLISRLAIQQFQRMVRSRAGQFKALYWAPKGQDPLIRRSHLICGGKVDDVFSRGLKGDVGEAKGGEARRSDDSKEVLKLYVRDAEKDGQGFPNPGEVEKFKLYGNLFGRSLEEKGLGADGGLSAGLNESIALELLAMIGTLGESRAARVDGSEKINVGAGKWAFQGRRWAFGDDLVIRGLAYLAVYGESVLRLVQMAARGRHGVAVQEWIQTVYQDQLGSLRGEIRFGQQEQRTAEQQRQREASVQAVLERRDLLASATVIYDEPDLRRLVALVVDEVQQFAIPPSGKNPGDGGYYEVARAGMAMNILATQFPHSLKGTLGESFHRYLGNILTWIVLRQPLKEDAEIVANLIGSEVQSEQMKLSGTLQSAGATSGGLRGTAEDYNVSWEPKGEAKQRVTITELLEQESMQAFAVVSDGQRRSSYKLYTTPYFVITGRKVNPYGPKGLLLRAEEEQEEALHNGKEFVLSYKRAMEIVQDHGYPLVEMPVVELIQNRVMDMSKTRSEDEVQQDSRLHAMRAAQKIGR